MPQPQCLEPQLLDQLELRWRRVGAPIAGSLVPGISDLEMDDVTASLGIKLPSEARTSWPSTSASTQSAKDPSHVGSGVTVAPGYQHRR